MIHPKNKLDLFNNHQMFLISFIIRVTNALLKYIFPIKSVISSEQKIYVKCQSRSVPVFLRKNWTVFDLKQCVKQNMHIGSEDELHVIFAGQELEDEMLLQDCDVGEQSIIHAIPSRKALSTCSEENEFPCGRSGHGCFLSNSLDEEQNGHLNENLKSYKKRHFFVYCSHPCRSMTPGKLRVRCLLCKEGTLTLNREPACWDDVLIPGRIRGVCHAEDCDGSVAQFYFKCANHVTLPGDSAVALYLIKNNFKEIPCIACTDIGQLVLVFPCKDGHVICLECFGLYCSSRLNERKFIQSETLGYTLNCPAGCPDSLIEEPHHFKLLGEDQYHRYERFAAEEYVLQAGGVLCPQPGCGAGLFPDPDCSKVTCLTDGGGGCGYVFCKICLQGYHIGSCETMQMNDLFGTDGHKITDERAGTSRWDEDSRNVIKITTKPCPKCRTPTERDGGCMHMVCTRSQCGFHWCWVCQEEWTRECMGNHWFV